MGRLPSLEEIQRERTRRSTDRAAALALKRAKQDADKVRAECKTLVGFIRHAWPILEPRTPFIYSWHIGAVADHLEAITAKQITRFQCNQPPGTAKSSVVSVMWPAWEWGPAGMAYIRYLTAGYMQEWARRDSRKMRDLILSEWYQTLWPITLTRDSEMNFANTEMGFRQAMPYGSLTSGRGNRVILDDPHSVANVESDTEREEAIRLFRESITSRLDDPIHDAIMVIMHRLRPDDICGEIERLGLDYVKLILPMEYDPSTTVATKWFTDPRRHEGDLLCPERMPREVVEKNKLELGSHAYATQFQQRASHRSGGMFKRHWFKIVDAIPAEAYRRRVRRWDLAGSIPKNGSDPDWTVGLRMCTHDHKFYIDDEIRFRDVGYRVRQAIRNTAEADGRETYIVVPQDPAQAGKEQAQSIIAENAGYRISAERETGAKETRAEPFAAQLEAGNVFLLKAPWNEGFISELCEFPQGKADRVDAASGAFNFLAQKKGPVVFGQTALQRALTEKRRY